ncbi:MAG: hypothetical protein ACLQU4_03685 [Limisphaerales bacterium]
MKDFDLELKVKALRVPERDEDYWQAFPNRVMRELRRAPEQPARRVFMPGLMWGARLALACVMLGFCLWQSRMPATLSHALRKDEKELRQSVERIHDNLGRLMQDEHGLDKLVEDQP